uniref:Uncharacterized protein n=1 Tax=viral metagenome TaxID=1070528 RepID=A0A2V0RKQ8_9ZZZZ
MSKLVYALVGIIADLREEVKKAKFNLKPGAIITQTYPILSVDFNLSVANTNPVSSPVGDIANGFQRYITPFKEVIVAAAVILKKVDAASATNFQFFIGEPGKQFTNNHSTANALEVRGTVASVINNKGELSSSYVIYNFGMGTANFGSLSKYSFSMAGPVSSGTIVFYSRI